MIVVALWLSRRLLEVVFGAVLLLATGCATGPLWGWARAEDPVGAVRVIGIRARSEVVDLVLVGATEKMDKIYSVAKIPAGWRGRLVVAKESLSGHRQPFLEAAPTSRSIRAGLRRKILPARQSPFYLRESDPDVLTYADEQWGQE